MSLAFRDIVLCSLQHLFTCCLDSPTIPQDRVITYFSCFLNEETDLGSGVISLNFYF